MPALKTVAYGAGYAGSLAMALAAGAWIARQHAEAVDRAIKATGDKARELKDAAPLEHIPSPIEARQRARAEAARIRHHHRTEAFVGSLSMGPGSPDDEGRLAELTDRLAGMLAAEAHPNESLLAATVRLWREVDDSAQRRFGNANPVAGASHKAWEKLFFEVPPSADVVGQPAAWTHTRQAGLISPEQFGTDEVLVRLAAAIAVLGDKRAPLAQAVADLWRAGAVPTLTPDGVVAIRDGKPVARSAPDRGLS